MTDTTINPDEIAKFAAMADDWWDPNGKFKPLHKFNPVRLAYIRDWAIRHFGRDETERQPLAGLRLLDIGCGGGLLTEPLTRLGAEVTGIDAGARNVAVAKLHATRMGLTIDYRDTTAESLTANGASFDIVLNMEVVEHVDNVPLYMKSCADLVAPGGLLFSATINRTARALAFAKFAAEYILRWLPRGTHDWNKFLTPDELKALITRNGLTIADETGVVFHPLADEWRKSRDMGINYMVLAERPAASRVSSKP
ncbi:MAG: bifunctional 2-polyprenyl-6-hydroxyphenol methylase/3-demethylubiquinol 3-O-methyltransferase UbiG [Devosia nanyangense]|uniref:Ubiquinone biosynthesis O-methyltransferase n=1 Tax=Devosia nanyangense TaxID=1228055 RepID=A0A933L789_9HYPH|nr:bifunctional 2-polyprenyl-6-hydroxyphenol methylase/3-demethylubiquinol 3-O-methyltransferase UbiG [Devosia nanyangense]